MRAAAFVLALAGCAASAQDATPALVYYILTADQVHQLNAVLANQRAVIGAQAAEIRRLKDNACAPGRQGT